MFLELTSLGHLPRGSASASLLPKASLTPFYSLSSMVPLAIAGANL